MIRSLAAIVSVAAMLLAAGNRHASAETAADCTVAGMAAPAVEVTADTAQTVVGRAVSLGWATSPQADRPTMPTYLVLATADVARFEGVGFFAIAPGADGPHGMAYAADRTRAIVPLHTDFSASEGVISVLLYRAGQAAVELALVQVDPCGNETIAQRETIRLRMLPGAPQLIGRDEFASRRPDLIVTPDEGPYQARLYGQAIEVSDRRNGEVVLQTTGEYPVFSPSGRFLSVETGEEQTLDVFDLAAQRRIGRYLTVEGMYWSHHDSFLYVDYGWFGAMRLVRTLHSAGEAPETEPAVPYEAPELSEAAPGVDLAALDGGGSDPAAGIDPGSGGHSGTPGSLAWSVRISLETGLAIFLNTNAYLPDQSDLDYTDGVEFGGRIVDLGRARPMIRTRDRGELQAVLGERFGLSGIEPRGWSADVGIWQSFTNVVPAEEDTGEPDDADASASAYPHDFVFSDKLLQDEREGSSPASPDDGDFSQGVLRGAISMATRTEPGRMIGAEDLRLLGQREIANLRSGEDDEALEAVSAELGTHYAAAVAQWRFAAGEPRYDTQPFPDPYPDVVPQEPAVIDLAAEGRDTWTWTIGDQSFWLTQTVESNRRGHAFDLSMLRLRDGRLARANVLQGDAANEDASDGRLFEIGDVRGSLGDAFADPSFVAVAGERYLLVATQPVARLVAFDLDTMKPVCRVPAPAVGADIERLALTAELGHLLQFNGNGQVGVYDCRDGARVLTGLFADDELVVMDRNGFFDGSEDAAAYVELKIPGLPGRHVLSQFAGTLRRPGLLKATLARTPGGQAPPALLPPALAVSVPDAAGDDGIEMRAESESGLASLQLFANGRLVLRRELDGRAADIRLAKRDLPEAGFATAIVSDADGLTSAPLEIVLDRTFRRMPGRLVGLAVGVDAYPGLPGSDLGFAAADARRIAAAAGRSELYAGAEVTVLTDREATADAILDALDRIVAAAGEDDTILLSFATHGLIGGNGGLRLALSETAALDIDGTSLEFDAVVSRLARARARAIVLLDACHAGASGQSGAANDVAVRQLLSGSGSGIVVLAASKGRQLSEETAARGGGRFSVAIDEILSERRAASDLDGNAALSVLELYRAVKEKVSAETRGRQIPWIARNKLLGDFDIF